MVGAARSVHPGMPMGHTDGLSAVISPPAPGSRTGGLARPRPVHVVRRTRPGAAVRTAARVQLRPAAGGVAELLLAPLSDVRAPRHPGTRSTDVPQTSRRRSGREAGSRKRGRNGVGRAHAARPGWLHHDPRCHWIRCVGRERDNGRPRQSARFGRARREPTALRLGGAHRIRRENTWHLDVRRLRSGPTSVRTCLTSGYG